MSIVVQKFGGSSVADVDRIRKVAERVAETRNAGKQVVVVVSAMGATTDDLLSLARGVCESPARRELDMLLTAGERISMALLSMALNALGVPAVSFTGSQSGIITNDSHANARIVEVRPYRVQDELERGKVVIVAGYQGVSYKKEVTTLGRGGSDTTAVALAAALGAEACEIYSDVEGVYSADPRVVPDSRRLSEISYEEMQELAEAGARVLNAQAVEFAKEKGIAIYARSSFGGPGETVVRKLAPGLPGRVVGVASERNLLMLQAASMAPPRLVELLSVLDERGAGGKQLLHDGFGTSLLLSLANLPEHRSLIGEIRSRFGGEVEVLEGIGAISAIGSGINSDHGNTRRTLMACGEAGIEVKALSTSSFRITVLVDEAQIPSGVRSLHAALVTG